MNGKTTNTGFKIWEKIPSETEEGKEYTVTAFFKISAGYDKDTLQTDVDIKCDCPAFTYQEGPCKHIKTLCKQFTDEDE